MCKGMRVEWTSSARRESSELLKFLIMRAVVDRE
jgi:hypothetical protein